MFFEALMLFVGKNIFESIYILTLRTITLVIDYRGRNMYLALGFTTESTGSPQSKITRTPSQPHPFEIVKNKSYQYFVRFFYNLSRDQFSDFSEKL